MSFSVNSSMSFSAARRLLLGYVVLNASSGVAVGMAQLALPLFALHLGASPAEIGLIRGVAGASLLFSAIPAGFLVDSFGAGRMFHLGNGAAMICGLSLLMVGSPWALLVALTAESVARSLKFNAIGGSFYQALSVIGVDKVGWLRGSFSIGLGFGGPLLGGFLLGRDNFALLFLIAVAIQLIPGLVFARLAAAAPKRRKRFGLLMAVKLELRAYSALIAHRDVAAALGAEAIVAGCFCGSNTFIGVAAVSELGLPVSAASLFVGAEGLTFVLAMFLLGSAVQRRSYRSAALTGLGVIALALTGVSLSSRVDCLIGFSALLGAGLGVLSLISSTRAGTLPGKKGKVAALFATTVSVGVAIAPVFAGGVAEIFGSRAVFVAFVPACLLLAACTAWERPGFRREAVEIPGSA
jgi:MFS family permease